MELTFSASCGKAQSFFEGFARSGAKVHQHGLACVRFGIVQGGHLWFFAVGAAVLLRALGKGDSSGASFWRAARTRNADRSDPKRCATSREFISPNRFFSSRFSCLARRRSAFVAAFPAQDFQGSGLSFSPHLLQIISFDNLFRAPCGSLVCSLDGRWLVLFWPWRLLQACPVL